MKTLRCAIYTRKSSEEGLEQDFNSLHAQREACEAYVKSQTGEGWVCLKAKYDDGGISGGTMERPALKALLADVAAGRVDVVVVYKVDRLTRSLTDFAKIVEVFDKRQVSFVSITQSFNTTSSMGRLTLNVLLSFAQFEREVTGERIRDKIAASKKKGLWMGGLPPLGYEPDGRTLKIVETEAALVRHIFERYLVLGSVHLLADELKAEGHRSKAWTTKAGKQMGGFELRRGALYHLLQNPVYIGAISHHGAVHAGQHPPIIDAALWEQVRNALAAAPARRRNGRANPPHFPLVGKLFDRDGLPMSPSTTRNRHGKRYRYYVSGALMKGGRSAAVVGLRRLPAQLTEAFLAKQLGGADNDANDALACVARAQLGEGMILLALADGRSIEVPLGLRLRGGGHRIQNDTRGPSVRTNRALTDALRQAHADADRIGFGVRKPSSGSPEEMLQSTYARERCRLAFLAPDIQAAIISGDHSERMSVDRLLRVDWSPSWATQRSQLAHFNERV